MSQAPDSDRPLYLFTGVDPGNGVHHLITVWPDGSATIAYRDDRRSTWGPPHPLHREEV